MAQEKRQLTLYSETELELRAPAGFPVSCPTLDLCTTWDADSKNLFIYRPPSQVVSKIHQFGHPGEKAPEAVAVTWKPDGQFLAVGWSDGIVRLMGLENNKVAHHLPVCGKTDDQNAKITYIGWSSASITDKLTTSFPGLSQGNLLADEWDVNGGDLPVNLPQELTFLEIDTALPKISPLPAASAGVGDDATVFTLRTGIDFLFRYPTREEYNQVNVMIVGTGDGTIQLSIYDSFVIGSFKQPHLGTAAVPRLIHHASHPSVPTHALLLAENQEDEPDQVHLIPMDMPFISSTPINLSLLASKLTTLQKLLRYINQAQLHMRVEWKNARELPTRFINSIQSDLEEMTTGPRSIVPALFHTIVTGHAYEPMREWLVDRLAERGHKRWDKAVMSGLEGLRSLVHENFLPALDRCAIILSRLRGLAQFYDTRDDIGFSTAQINRVMDTVSCLSLIGHKILVHTMDELEHFTAFSTWLRFQIDRLASSGSAAEELTEREATMDNAKVLAYVELYLTDSPLDMFFDDFTAEDAASDRQHIEDGASLLPLLDKQLAKREQGQPSMKALPHVEFLVDYVTLSSNKIFKDIAEAKRRSVRFGMPMKLSTGHPISKMDSTMCHDGQNGGIMYTALASKSNEGKACIFYARIDIVNGISSNQSLDVSRVGFNNRRIVDLKIFNGNRLILLCASTETDAPSIISISISANDLPYTPYNHENIDNVPAIDLHDFDEYLIEEQQTWRPIRLEVHSETNVRGEMPARICLLGSNRTTWRTFTIPT